MVCSQILEISEQSALKKSPVESFPVEADKKLSMAQIVGDFSLLPTIVRHGRKGFRVIAKW